MDSTTSAAAPASTSALSNDYRKIAWPGGPAKKQSFSLPERIIYYMAKNPSSPKVCLKLAMSSKYFFEKNPLLIVPRIYDDGSFANHQIFEFNTNLKRCVHVELAKITKSNIWLNNELKIYNDGNPNFVSTVLPKLYECKNAKLTLFASKMTMEEYKLLATKFLQFSITRSKIIDADRSVVTIDSMLEAITTVKRFVYWYDNKTPAAVTSSTMKNILKLKNLEKLELLDLIDVPETLNVKDLSAFIKTYKNSTIAISYHRNLSDEYKVQLDTLIDDIIASEVPNRLIFYHEQDNEKLKIMKRRYSYR